MKLPNPGSAKEWSVGQVLELVEQLRGRIAQKHPVLVREGLLDDVIQTTNLKVLEWMATGRPIRNPPAWVCKVAENSGIDLLRKQPRSRLQTVISQVDWADAIPDRFVDPLELRALDRASLLSEAGAMDVSAVAGLLARSAQRFCASPLQRDRYLQWLGTDPIESGSSLAPISKSTFSRSIRSAEEWATAGAIVLAAESDVPALLVSPTMASRRPFNVGMMRKFDIIRQMPLDWVRLRPGFEAAWGVATARLVDLLDSAKLTLHPVELDVLRACEWVLCVGARLYAADFKSAFVDLWSRLSKRGSFPNPDCVRTIATVGSYASADDYQRAFLAAPGAWNAELSNVLAYIASARRDDLYPIHLTFHGQSQPIIDVDRRNGLALHKELASYAIDCIQSPRYDQGGLNSMVLVWLYRALLEARMHHCAVVARGIRPILEANESKLRAADSQLFDKVANQAHRYEADSDSW